ncbi:MAG: PorV/PorQ family protein [bacterium]
MKKIKYIIPMLVVALLMAPMVYGDGVKKIAQTGMKWLSIPIGARASAMGSAFTALGGDPSVLFWNPGALGMIEGKSVFLSQTRWIADIQVNGGAVSYNTGNYGVIGFSIAAVQWGDLHGTRRASTSSGYVETGTFSPTNWAAGVAYALKVSEQFSFGGHLKYAHENLGSTLEGTMDNPREYTAEMNIVVFDFGTLYYTGFKDLRIGMTLQNFSQEKAYRAESYPLPLTFKFGMAMDIMSLMQESDKHKLTLSVDAMHPRDFTERLYFGGEYNFRDILFLRGGYKTNHDEQNISFGGGLKLDIQNMKVGLNYSMLNFSNFDSVHMFSFDFEF